MNSILTLYCLILSSTITYGWDTYESLSSISGSKLTAPPSTVPIASSVTNSGFGSNGTLIEYPYTSADKSIAAKIIGNQTTVSALPMITPNVTTSTFVALNQLPKESHTLNGSSSRVSMEMFVSSSLEEQLALVQITKGDMECFIAPPAKSFDNMDGVW